MKRIVSFIIALTLCITLGACDKKSKKSEAVLNVENCITDAESTSIDKGTALATAEELYSQLTPEEKEQVKNYDVLIEAKEEYLKERCQAANEQIAAAASLTIDGVYDLYAAWYFGVNEAAQSFSDEELFYEDFSYAVYKRGKHAFTPEKLKAAAETYGYTYSQVRKDWSKCVDVIIMATTIKGTFEEIGDELEQADEIISEMTKLNADSQYTKVIKEYYMAVFNYVSTYVNPSGSLLDLVDTIKSSEKKIEECANNVNMALKW